MPAYAPSRDIGAYSSYYIWGGDYPKMTKLGKFFYLKFRAVRMVMLVVDSTEC